MKGSNPSAALLVMRKNIFFSTFFVVEGIVINRDKIVYYNEEA